MKRVDDQQPATPPSAPEHVCGLQGFGNDINDHCPACATLFLCLLDKSKCDHEWQHGDGRNDDRCTRCGQGFLAYVHMEAP